MGSYTQRRKQIYERDKGICHLCKKHVEFEDSTLDHVVPRSLNGSNKDNNLKIAHDRCNNERGNLPLDIYEKQKVEVKERIIVKSNFARRRRREIQKTKRCMICLGSGLRKDLLICRVCNGWGMFKE